MQSLQEFVTSLGWRVANSGVEAAEAELLSLAELAMRRSEAVTAAGVLADRGQPEVARTRAFSLVAAAVLRSASLVDAPAA